MIDTPELDKMAAAKAQGSQEVGRFLEWLDQQGLTIARPDKNDWLMPDYKSIEQRLAAFYGVDLDAVERERRALLDALV